MFGKVSKNLKIKITQNVDDLTKFEGKITRKSKNNYEKFVLFG